MVNIFPVILNIGIPYDNSQEVVNFYNQIYSLGPWFLKL